MTDTGPLLVHAVIPGGAVAPLPPGARAVACGEDLSAVVTSLADIDPQRLFDDPQRVTGLAVAHNDLLAALIGHLDVVPLRLGTVVSGTEALQALAAAHGVGLRSALATVAGRVEFGVTLSARPVQAPAALVSDGRGWLQARAVAQRARRGSVQLRPEVIQRVRDLIAAAAGGPVRITQASAGSLLQAACLVPRDGSAAFVADVTRIDGELAADGHTIVLTGPWPPYSFVDLDPERRIA